MAMRKSPAVRSNVRSIPGPKGGFKSGPKYGASPTKGSGKGKGC